MSQHVETHQKLCGRYNNRILAETKWILMILFLSTKMERRGEVPDDKVSTAIQGAPRKNECTEKGERGIKQRASRVQAATRSLQSASTTSVCSKIYSIKIFKVGELNFICENVAHRSDDDNFCSPLVSDTNRATELGDKVDEADSSRSCILS